MQESGWGFDILGGLHSVELWFYTLGCCGEGLRASHVLGRYLYPYLSIPPCRLMKA